MQPGRIRALTVFSCSLLFASSMVYWVQSRQTADLIARLYSGLFEEILYDLVYDILYDYPSNDLCSICHHEQHSNVLENQDKSHSSSSHLDHLMIPCLHCNRTLSSHRYSSHLEKCLGLGGRRTKKDTLNTLKKNDAGVTATTTGSSLLYGHGRLTPATANVNPTSRSTTSTSTASLLSGSGETLGSVTNLAAANPFDFMTDSSGISSFDPSESDSDFFSSQSQAQKRGSRKKSSKKK